MGRTRNFLYFSCISSNLPECPLQKAKQRPHFHTRDKKKTQCVREIEGERSHWDWGFSSKEIQTFLFCQNISQIFFMKFHNLSHPFSISCTLSYSKSPTILNSFFFTLSWGLHFLLRSLYLSFKSWQFTFPGTPQNFT